MTDLQERLSEAFNLWVSSVPEGSAGPGFPSTGGEPTRRRQWWLAGAIAAAIVIIAVAALVVPHRGTPHDNATVSPISPTSAAVTFSSPQVDREPSSTPPSVLAGPATFSLCLGSQLERSPLQKVGDVGHPLGSVITFANRGDQDCEVGQISVSFLDSSMHSISSIPSQVTSSDGVLAPHASPARRPFSGSGPLELSIVIGPADGLVASCPAKDIVAPPYLRIDIGGTTFVIPNVKAAGAYFVESCRGRFAISASVDAT